MRILAGGLALAGLVAAGCGEPTSVPADPALAAQLTVRFATAPAPNGAISTEGAVQRLELRRAEGDGLVAEADLTEDEPFRRPLAPGRYLVVSFTRPCVANCGNLGEPVGRCERQLELGPRERVTVRLEATVGERCTIRPT